MKKISIAEPVTELKRISIIECGDPLVNFLAACPDLTLDKPHFDYQRETLIRKAVCEMLCLANEWLLMRDFKLLILEGWRPPHIQKRMYLSAWNAFKKMNPEWSLTKLKRTVNRYSAPMNFKVPPPHTTGGAVDLALGNLKNERVDHYSPYEWRDTKSFIFDAPDLSADALKHRSLLKEALELAGLTNYPSEYWHWSYGDQGWAYRNGELYAHFGAITPDGWSPNEDDDVDEALRFVAEEK